MECCPDCGIPWKYHTTACGIDTRPKVINMHDYGVKKTKEERDKIIAEIIKKAKELDW